jgi:release factor glutamine methyltransferase
VTVGEALAQARKTLIEIGVESAALDARLLVAAALGTRIEQVIAWPERAMPEEAAARMKVLLQRRLDREPMSQILGRREFWSLEFTVTSDVLTPRPDSETLIAAVLDRIADKARPLTLLDLGVGSGCLLLSLLSELPNASGVGVDRSAAALAVARGNAAALGLSARARFVRGDWLSGLDARFDIVVANPPYIPTADIAGLAPELRHEPHQALDGGRDGLDAYRAIAREVRRALVPRGLLAVEIGAGQGEAVTAILRAAGLELIASTPDLSGRERCLLASFSH